MLSILLVGLDEALLRTRAAVLSRTGCRTVCAMPADALARQVEHEASLIVLCHTLPVSVAAALIQAIRGRWPDVSVMLVQKRSAVTLDTAVPGVDAVTSCDPERVLRCAAALMGNGIFARPEAARWKTSAYLN